MGDFMFWFGVVANSFTVLAGLIAIAGVVWAIRGRAQLAVTHFSHPSTAPSLTLSISSVGSNPVRDLELNYGTLLDNGFSMMGVDFGSRAVFNRGESLTVVGFEDAEMKFGSEPRGGEYRLKIQPGEGWYLNLQRQFPLFPWRRSSRTYAWLPARRFACAPPEALAGRKEISFLKRTRDPSLNPLSPGYVAQQDAAPRAIVATDGTFDELVTGHKGPVLVGFGPTWQDKGWEDVKRMLDALAAKHGPRVKVLVVNIDECPMLTARFATNEAPVFKLLLKGGVTKSHVGGHSLPELEREFGDDLG